MGVHRTLALWFDSKDAGADLPPSGEGSGLGKFDDAVRTLFGPFVMQGVGLTKASYRSALMISLPWFWAFLDSTADRGRGLSDVEVMLQNVTRHFLMFMVLMPAIFKCTEYQLVVMD